MSLPRPVCTASEPAAPSPALAPRCTLSAAPYSRTHNSVPSEPWRCPCHNPLCALCPLSPLSIRCARLSTAFTAALPAVLYCCAGRGCTAVHSRQGHGSAGRGCTSTDGACSILLCRPLESLAAGCCWPCSSDTRSSNSRCTSQPAKETLRSTRSQRACYAWSVY